MNVGMLFLTFCLAGVADDPVVLKEIDLTLPQTIADIKYQRKKVFAQKALGYGVTYSSKLCIISMYVYDHDKKDIADGKDSILVQDQMKISISDLRTAEKSGSMANVQSMKEVSLPKAVKETFATAGFTFDVKGGACKSYILLVGRNKHFLKVRVTQYVVDGKTNDREVNEFLAVLAKAVKAPAK
jgi:hypothetical protein